MLCVPTDSEEVLNVAEPPPKEIGDPRFTPPSMNCTVPVAVPDPGARAETVAVKVTACPKTEGFAFEVTAVELEAWLTVCVGSDPVLPVKFASPL
jgi:hypothetical protein